MGSIGSDISREVILWEVFEVIFPMRLIPENNQPQYFPQTQPIENQPNHKTKIKLTFDFIKPLKQPPLTQSQGGRFV